MRLPITDEMRESSTVGEMADAFHPQALWAQNSHPSNVLDAIEAALLYGAGRIHQHEFMSAIEDIGEWEERDAEG